MMLLVLLDDNFRWEAEFLPSIEPPVYAGVGLADHDRDPCRAESANALRELLGRHKSYVFTLIPKFHKELAEGEVYSDRYLRVQVLVGTVY